MRGGASHAQRAERRPLPAHHVSVHSTSDHSARLLGDWVRLGCISQPADAGFSGPRAGGEIAAHQSLGYYWDLEDELREAALDDDDSVSSDEILPSDSTGIEDSTSTVEGNVDDWDSPDPPGVITSIAEDAPGHFCLASGHACPRVYATLTHKQKSIRVSCLDDTGGSHNYMTPDMADILGLSVEKTGPNRFTAAGGTTHPCQGMVRDVEISFRTSPRSTVRWTGKGDFVVADVGCADVILGIPFWAKYAVHLEYSGDTEETLAITAMLVGETNKSGEQFRVPVRGTPDGDALNSVEKDSEWKLGHKHKIHKAEQKRYRMGMLNIQTATTPPGYEQVMASVRADADAFPEAEAFTQEMVDEFGDIFQEPTEFPPEREVEHQMEVNGPVPPGRKVQRYSLAELDAIREWIDTMLKKGWLEPSRSATGAPILCIVKPGGGMRIVQDFRLLNSVTKPVNTPLPVFDNLLKTMTGCRYWSCLDISQMYWQIRIAKKDRELCAVATPYGQWTPSKIKLGQHKEVTQWRTTGVLAGLCVYAFQKKQAMTKAGIRQRTFFACVWYKIMKLFLALRNRRNAPKMSMCLAPARTMTRTRVLRREKLEILPN